MHRQAYKQVHAGISRNILREMSGRAWEDGPPSEGACARAAAVAAAGSPVAHCCTAGTEAVASATAVPPPIATASAIATACHKEKAAFTFCCARHCRRLITCELQAHTAL